MVDRFTLTWITMIWTVNSPTINITVMDLIFSYASSISRRVSARCKLILILRIYVFFTYKTRINVLIGWLIHWFVFTRHLKHYWLLPGAQFFIDERSRTAWNKYRFSAEKLTILSFITVYNFETSVTLSKDGHCKI